MPKTTPPNSAELDKLFALLKKATVDLWFAFSPRVSPKKRIWQIRRSAGVLGRKLLRLDPKKRTFPTAGTTRRLTYDEFTRKVRRVCEDCFDLLVDPREMDSVSRFRSNGRRLMNRGWKLLVLSNTKPFDREALVRRIKQLEEREAARERKRQSVISIDDPQHALALKDRSRSRFVLNVGPSRIVFECTARTERRSPTQDDAPAPVIEMKNEATVTTGLKKKHENV